MTRSFTDTLAKRFLALTTFIPLTAYGGTVSLPPLGAAWESGPNPGQSLVTSSDGFVVDLDDRTGLTPGLAIRITVSSPDSFLWVGGFQLDGGLTTIASDVDLSLMLGGET